MNTKAVLKAVIGNPLIAVRSLMIAGFGGPLLRLERRSAVRRWGDVR